MKFCDKLPKLRKNNNYSQEQLAEKLNVSRQAVSKWELGGSYPDMDKMIQICKILNCNLEDLMDDGVIGDSSSGSKSHKFDINLYMKDFLNFITKSYNMFCSMNFKEKLKFLFEMSCISIVLFTIGIILSLIMHAFILNITGYSTISWTIANIVTDIFAVIIGIIGLIIVLHLYKIRYLDYFITIEDQNVTEKTIEEPIEKKENKYYQEQPKEKIIIRDPKHSTFSFFDLFGKIILVIVKATTIICAVPTVALFVFLVSCVLISAFHIQYGILFLWIVLLFLGLTLLNYIIIELMYNFIVTKKQHLKRIFITGIIGLLLIGAGMGLMVPTYLNFEHISEPEESQFTSTVINLTVKDNTIFYYNGYENIIIDDSVDGIQIELKSIDNMQIEFKSTINNKNNYDITVYHDYGYEQWIIHAHWDFLTTYKFVLDDIKNKNSRNYDSLDFMQVTSVTMSQATKDMLDNNFMEREATIQEIMRLEQIKQDYYCDYHDCDYYKGHHKYHDEYMYEYEFED